MKFQDWIKSLIITAFALTLISCSSTTPKPTGEGSNIDDSTIGDVAATDAGNMGVPEEARLNTKDGVEYGKWDVIHFDYDSAAIQEKDRSVLEEIAKWAKANPAKKIMIAGHCDERGTLEYNRALGQRRASAAREYLIKLGVNHSNLGTVSYGEEQPSDPAHSEDAWTQNRRDEFGIVK